MKRTAVDSSEEERLTFLPDGWMAEWSKAAVLKTAVRVSVPGVRIPLHPLFAEGLPSGSFLQRLENRCDACLLHDPLLIVDLQLLFLDKPDGLERFTLEAAATVQTVPDQDRFLDQRILVDTMLQEHLVDVFAYFSCLFVVLHCFSFCQQGDGDRCGTDRAMRNLLSSIGGFLRMVAACPAFAVRSW